MENSLTGLMEETGRLRAEIDRLRTVTNNLTDVDDAMAVERARLLESGIPEERIRAALHGGYGREGLEELFEDLNPRTNRYIFGTNVLANQTDLADSFRMPRTMPNLLSMKSCINKLYPNNAMSLALSLGAMVGSIGGGLAANVLEEDDGSVSNWPVLAGGALIIGTAGTVYGVQRVDCSLLLSKLKKYKSFLPMLKLKFLETIKNLPGDELQALQEQFAQQERLLKKIETAASKSTSVFEVNPARKSSLLKRLLDNGKVSEKSLALMLRRGANLIVVGGFLFTAKEVIDAAEADAATVNGLSGNNSSSDSGYNYNIGGSQ